MKFYVGVRMIEIVGTKGIILTFSKTYFLPHLPIQERSALTHELCNSKGLENVLLCQRIPILTTAGSNPLLWEGQSQ